MHCPLRPSFIIDFQSSKFRYVTSCLTYSDDRLLDYGLWGRDYRRCDRRTPNRSHLGCVRLRSQGATHHWFNHFHFWGHSSQHAEKFKYILRHRPRLIMSLMVRILIFYFESHLLSRVNWEAVIEQFCLTTVSQLAIVDSKWKITIKDMIQPHLCRKNIIFCSDKQ